MIHQRWHKIGDVSQSHAHTFAIRRRVSCGVNRRIVDNTRTRSGLKEFVVRLCLTSNPNTDVPSSPCVLGIEG
jgi:hypothetical protein